MDKPFVIRFSEEESETQETSEDVMVDRVVSYFSHPDAEGHRRWWKKRKRNREIESSDYYYV
ncbi:MAG: hypothetical protein ACMUHY_09715 [Thermoplasmatota archaeon]